MLLVLANAAPGTDDEFNDWYENQHIPDVLSVPGFLRVRRFALSEHQLPGAQAVGAKYLTLWDVEADDLEAPLAEMAARVGSDSMPISARMVVVGDQAVRTALFQDLGETAATSPTRTPTS